MTEAAHQGYSLPRSDTQAEKSRLDLQHQKWCLVHKDRLFSSQVPKDVKRILDVGTGAGSWATEVARIFPEAEVIGTDVTPPTTSTLDNLTFMKANAEESWPFPPGHFDFIHGRMLVGAIHDWPSFLQKCYEHLAPGGQLELPESCYPWNSALAGEGVTPVNSAFMRWASMAGQAWARAGFDTFHVLRHEYRLQRLGFVDIEHDESHWPVGPWETDERQKQIGDLCLRIYGMFMKTAGVPILTMNGFMETEEAEQLNAEALQDVEENHMSKKYFIPVKVTRAKKPKD